MRRQILLLPFCLLLCLSTAFAESAATKAIDDLIAKNQLTQALELINKGLASNPKDVPHLARKSRVISIQADQEDEDKKVKLYEEAEKIANSAVEAGPANAGGYLRHAAAKGKLGLFKGILESRKLVLDLRADSKKVLELGSANNYQKALANYMLGRVHLKLAKKPKVMRIPLGLGWASKKKGAKFLKTSTELAPNSISFNLAYGEYLKDKGEDGQAKAIFQKIASMPVFDPADNGHKETAKKYLSE